MPVSEGRIESYPRINDKLLPVIFVIDTSESMRGEHISKVNEAMNKIVDVLKEMSDNSPTAELKIGVLHFAFDAKWATDGLISIADYSWQEPHLDGSSMYGPVLDELYKKLSRKELLSSETGYKVPTLIFMTNGCPSDEDTFEESLDNLKKNKWFRVANKIGFGVGANVREEIIAKVIGSPEAVVYDVNAITSIIMHIGVTRTKLVNYRLYPYEHSPYGENPPKLKDDELWDNGLWDFDPSDDKWD